MSIFAFEIIHVEEMRQKNQVLLSGYFFMNVEKMQQN